MLGMIVTMFPEPREQAKAIGVYGFVASAGGSIGLLPGGVLTEAINWHWIFFVNVPIGDRDRVPRQRGSSTTSEGIGLRQGADLPGAVLLTTGLMLGVYTILEIGEQGWGSTQTLALGGVSLALLAAFVARQARIPNPLMPLRLFKSRNVAGANLVMALLVAGMFAMFFLGALYLQRDPGLRPARRSASPSCPSTIVDGHHVAALLRAPQHALRRTCHADSRASCSIGVGLLLFARTPVDGNYIDRRRAARWSLIGLGAGLGFPSLMTLVDVGRDAERLGPRIGPGQLDRPGRRRDRPRRARNARDLAHRRAARGRRVAACRRSTAASTSPT